MPFRDDLTPPRPEKQAHSTTTHGDTLQDPYAWMKDAGYPNVTNEAILSHLADENAYFKAVMEPLSGLKDTLFKELKGRVNDEESAVPQRDGAFYYQWLFETGAQYRSWYRWPNTLGADAARGDKQLLLSEPDRAEGHDHYVLGALSVSFSDELAVIGEDVDGSERYTLRVKHLEGGDFADDVVTDTRGDAIWAKDNSGFFYILLDENHRPYRVMFHTLGQSVEADRLIYEEADPGFYMGMSMSQDRQYLIIAAGDHRTAEVRLVPLDAHMAQPIIVAQRTVGVDYSVDHGGGYLYILINDQHRNFRLVRTRVDQRAPEHWQDMESPSDSRYLRGITAFENFFVLSERVDGLDQIYIRNHDAQDGHYIPFPEESYAAGLGNNPEYGPVALRLAYQSMVTPPTVYDYDTASKTLTTLKVKTIPSGYDADAYRTERLMAPARDGTLVPISIVYKKGFEKGKAAPLHLYGYGAYGLGMSPSFSASRLSLLDRGFAFAIAHIRGGDELGYGWYTDGKLMRRWNTFADFIDCADYLIAEGYGARGRISISGGSAGGTLMGAALNIGQDRWKAVIAHVPFVDVLNTMMDESLPLTPAEWPEWGDPIRDPAAYALIKSYSPYENVTEAAHPPILVTGGLSDPRVTYWEPAKWTARLRERGTGSGPVVLKMNMGAGHQGKSGRFTALEETAEEYAFLLAAFGLEGED